MKRLLIVAGHDPSGAGIDADRAGVGDLPLEVVAVVTAWTDQDSQGVQSLGARAATEWLAEALEHARAGVDGLKLGLLPGAEHVRSARQLVRALRQRYGTEFPIVVDPVLAASSGARFLDAEATELVRGELIGAGVVLTPNLTEAAELACVPRARLGTDLDARREAARILLALGASAVLVKGGHGTEDPVRDLVSTDAGELVWLSHPRVAGGKIRGSGCRYAARLAGGLVLGRTLESAAEDAARHVSEAIARSGAGVS